MIIFTENLKTYSKMFDKVKIAKVAYYGSVYLDFSEKFLYFQNESTIVRLPLMIDTNEENIDNVYIFDGNKFFLLVNQYSEITFDGSIFYSPSQDKFNLSLFRESFDIPSFEPDNTWESLNLSLTSDLLFHIKNAMSYIPLDQEALKGIFFIENNLIAISQQKFYQAHIENLGNFNLSYDFLKILLSFESPEKVVLYKQVYGDAHRYIFKSDDVSIRFVTSSNLSLPVDITSTEFIKSYEHENYFVLSKEKFLEANDILDSFVREIPNSKVSLKFNPIDESLTIYIDDDQNIIDFNLNVECYSSKDTFKDEEVYISFSTLHSIISQINSELIYVTFDPNLPAMKFSSGSEAEYFIIQTKIKI